MKHHQRK